MKQVCDPGPAYMYYVFNTLPTHELLYQHWQFLNYRHPTAGH